MNNFLIFRLLWLRALFFGTTEFKLQFLEFLDLSTTIASIIIPIPIPINRAAPVMSDEYPKA